MDSVARKSLFLALCDLLITYQTRATVAPLRLDMLLFLSAVTSPRATKFCGVGP